MQILLEGQSSKHVKHAFIEWLSSEITGAFSPGLEVCGVSMLNETIFESWLIDSNRKKFLRKGSSGSEL